MTSKFDGKRAIESTWVTQQNLTRWKGGRAPYQPTPRLARPPVKRPMAAPAEAPAAEPIAPCAASEPTPKAS